MRRWITGLAVCSGMWAGCSGLSAELTEVDQDGDGVLESEDCNDMDPHIYPGAPESCELPLVDANCDGFVGGVDNDADGFRACDDCDDSNFDLRPNAEEICDGLDNDCDGLTDDADDSLDRQTGLTVYPDLDEDGYGDTLAQAQHCTIPPQWTDLAGDCDDTNADIHPDAFEICDYIDNDCDGHIDRDDEVHLTESDPVCYPDLDEDGFGVDADSGLHTCFCLSGESTLIGDCDDNDPDVHPEADFQLVETLAGSFDWNCDGVREPDYDLEGICAPLPKTGCDFATGWEGGIPECGTTANVIVGCITEPGTGTRPTTGTSGGTTGSTTGSTGDICTPSVVTRTLSCR